MRFARLSATLVACALFAIGRTASAWMETSVKSDNIELEVARDGSAVVTHAMVVRVRGGPLKTWIIRDVDADAEPLPDGTVVRARSGRAAGHPIPLTLTATDGNLHARVEYKKGLSGGSYLFHFRYRTALADLGGLRPAHGSLAFRWTGPTLDDGVDSVQLLLRVPKGARPPRLPRGETEAEAVAITEDFGGVFLSTLRRGSDVDELSIVRPHVAKLERVVWRAEIDPEAMDPALRPAETVAPPRPLPRDAKSRTGGPFPPRSSLIVSLVAGFLFGLLVYVKSRLLRSFYRARGGQPNFLVPVPPAVRPALVGGLLAGATWAGFSTTYPTLAGVLLLAAMTVAVELAPRIPTGLRGPGRWTELDAEALTASAQPTAHGLRWLDASTPRGFALFFLLIAGLLGAAVWVFQQSPYHGVFVALLSVAVLSVFCAGRAGAEATGPGTVRVLLRAHKRLVRHPAIQVVPIARLAAATNRPDEYRLRISVRRPLRGFLGLELGLDSPSGARASLTPFVVVRAEERSDCQEALPKGLLWTRGRTADERVAVVRPRVPTLPVWLAMTFRIIRALSVPALGRRGQPPTKAASSRGRGAVAVKPATASSPAHAT